MTLNMKTILAHTVPACLLCAGLLSLAPLSTPAAEVHSEATTTTDEPAGAAALPEARSVTTADVTIETSPEPEASRKDVPWLGVSTAEASEALASQLDLEPGVGLLITYVAPDSPAAKSGLRKNDVLAQFDDQSLVHPAQLRKLVRVRKEGVVVKLGFYRASKPQTVSVTLAQTRARPGLWADDEHSLKANFNELHQQLRDWHIDDTVRDQMRILRESLGNIRIDQKEVREDIRQGMDQARKAIQDALRNVTNTDSALSPMRKVLENFAHSGVTVDNKADVVVRSSGNHVKSMVKSDDSGTIVLLSNPKPQLTAHDKDSKLLFDGPIDSAEERAKVPRDLWERVEPLLDQMGVAAEQPESKDSQ
jgi:hypothetical protein